jgi:hypothetical protein
MKIKQYNFIRGQVSTGKTLFLELYLNTFVIKPSILI